MNALLVLNDAAGSLTSGKQETTASEVLAELRSTGIATELLPAPAARLGETLEEAVRAKPDVIIVGGGDGTVSTAAHYLADSGIMLGVLPLGTLNHFARDVGMPPTWRDAVVALARGESRAVDVGEVNGRVFVNNCSIGSYADAVRRRDALRRLRGLGKWWAMLLATIAVFRRLRRLRVRLETSGQTQTLRAPFVVVGNNRYSGHVLDYSLRPHLDEGRLWIYTTHAYRHAAVVRLMWQSLLRAIDEVDELEKLDVTSATIDYEYTRLPVALDGELADLRPPLFFRTRHAALRVLAPRKESTTP
jgi:diacylglycerol kinase family enzyme